MREIQTQKVRKRKRRRRKSGGCLGRLFFLVILFSLVGVLGYQSCKALGLYNRILMSRYPMKYQSLVDKYAGEFGLDAAMVYGVIHTESKFDPYAVSSAQAKGLMQLRDETARDCAKELKISGFTTDSLFEPEVNIRLGCYYLKKLLKTYNGNIETAIAAYNGGPGNVDKWLKDQSISKEHGILSHIPFPETQNYVERVMRAYQTYQKLYY